MELFVGVNGVDDVLAGRLKEIQEKKKRRNFFFGQNEKR